jgi:hypothetical protein
MIRRSLRAAGLLAAAAGILPGATPGAQRCSLQPEHAAMIVMQSPAAIQTKATGGCPVADYSEKGPGLAAFQLRNLCAKSGSQVLGSYVVDTSSGRLIDDASSRPVESPTLRTATAQVCSMSVRGVLPSLLPPATARRKPAATRVVASNSKKPVAKK